MDNLYMKGELLQVHTNDQEVFEGRFNSMNIDKSKISLYNVKGQNGIKDDGVLHFYNTEVKEIVKIQEPEDQRYLKISQKECEDIIKVSMTYIYINQIDKSFYEAIADLNEYSFIGLSTDGASMGRKCKIPFLVMSTPKQIYIFDIQVMQFHAFNAGIKKILGSEVPKKIVHDCRKLSDCLYHKHSVTLNSVFDTQVGDLIITKNKTNRLPTDVKTLGECLQTYLGVKPSTVDEKLDLLQCTERPLSVKIKETLSKNIAFLHRLSEVINDQMLLPFVRGVECFVENLRSCDDFKAWELCGKYNQLPKDFQCSIDY